MRYDESRTNRTRRRGRGASAHVLLAVLFLLGAPARAVEPTPRVAIVIDDLGNNLAEGRRVIALPAEVACAILPHTAYASTLAEEAHAAGKQVLLHLPMEAANGQETGPGRIEAQMPALELALTFEYDLSTVPHAVGVNNHMGSALTRQEPAMRALMQALAQRGGLFFLDSLTTPGSVARHAAAEWRVPYLKRDVFLDSQRSAASIAHSLERLEVLARARGAALAIGHPYPETLEALERWLPQAARRGIRIVAPSELLTDKEEYTHGPRARTARPGL